MCVCIYIVCNVIALCRHALARAIRSFQGHSSAVLRVAFLPNGMPLMTSSVDGLLKLWHIRTETPRIWRVKILCLAKVLRSKM